MKQSLMTFSMLADAATKKMDADTLCEICKKNGLTSVDLMPFDFKLYGQDKLTGALKANGIEVGCIIATPDFYARPKRVKDQVTEALDLCKKVGTKMLMVVPGSAMDAKSCRKKTRQELLDIAVQQFTDCVELAKSYGIQIGFENTPQPHKPLASAEDCKYVLDHVPGLGLIFDTGNFRVADTGCDELAIYEMLKSYIVRVHLKDVVVGHFKSGEACVDGQKIKAVVTGSGIIPIREIVERLVRDGYEGGLAVEYASPSSVHGIDEADVVAAYVGYIDEAIRVAEAKRNGDNEVDYLKPTYDRIDGIDIPVSKMFFGTAIGPMLMGKDVNHLLDMVYASGINAFDCARGYGMAEKALGRWMAERNNRDKVVILTKCGNVGMTGKVKVNRQVIEKEIATSLKTLGIDCIDIFLLHRDDPKTPVWEFIETLNQLKRDGKIRIFGVSNWTVDRIKEANDYAAAHNLEGFTVTEPNYGLTEQVNDPWGGDCISISGKANKESRDYLTEKAMPVLCYSSLGRGFFSGRFRAYDYEGAKKVLDAAAQKGYLYECNMDHLAAAEKIAERDGISVAQVALAYIYHTDMKTYAIVSASNYRRITQNIKACHIRLSEEDIAALEK